MDFFKELRNYMVLEITDQSFNQETSYCKAIRKLLSLTNDEITKILKWPISDLLEDCTEREYGVFSAVLYMQDMSRHLIASYLRHNLSRELHMYLGRSDNFAKGYKHAIRCLIKLSDQELLSRVGYDPDMSDRGFYKGYQSALYTLEDIYINFIEGININPMEDYDAD